MSDANTLNRWARPAGLAAVGGAVGYGLLRAVRWWRATHPRPVIGYVGGQPVVLQVVTLDGKPVEVRTAAAFERMREAAAPDGVEIQIVSGFRTMEQQTRLRQCYTRCDCNACRYAEEPGHSHHQTGRALDLNARAPGVFAWLQAHGAEFGFYNTVPSEPWHWEFWEHKPKGEHHE